MRALILLILAGSAFAAPNSGSRIVGGEPTTIEQYPFMVNMQYATIGSAWTSNCGGSLLTTRSVLSAASCFEGDIPEFWRAFLGSKYATSGFGGSVHFVSEFIVHPQYNTPVKDNNVAIVRLSNRAVYSNTVQPARIAGRNLNLPDGTRVTSIGWGASHYDGNQNINHEELQRVDINLISLLTCATRYVSLQLEPGFENWPNVRNSMLCAGILDEGGKGPCHRDFGGPLLFQRDIVVGITSWSYRCADEHYPGVYTRVSHYADWIVANG